MAQVLEFRLPDLGEGLTEAEIVRWLVDVGDVVAIDQPVVEVETAKAMVEVPCPYGGVVTQRFGDEGAELPVGAPLLTVAVGATEPAPAGSAERDGGAASRSEESSGNVLVGYGTGAPAARRRRIRPSSLSGGAGGARAASGPGPVGPAVGARCPEGRPGRPPRDTNRCGTAPWRARRPTHRVARPPRATPSWEPSRPPTRDPSRSSRRWCGGWPGTTGSICGRCGDPDRTG
ncbi:biotin/lipoyl-containing protein [Streptomyces sp. PmtA]|uniref:biotin/lipoyl-containing protein n=1 Tax=Streptomyces sp. PmtA TaxID=3074275 RepID=UPI003FCC4C0C